MQLSPSSKLHGKTLIFVGAYHPIAFSLLRNIKHDSINIILFGKHPYYISYVVKKISNLSGTDLWEKKNILFFSIDSKNYKHVKKAYSIIKEKFPLVDYLLFFEDYYTNLPVEKIPVHSVKILFYYNIWNLLNHIKAFRVFYPDGFPQILLLNEHNSTSLYGLFRKAVKEYLVTRSFPVSELFCSSDLLEKFRQRPRKKIIENYILEDEKVRIIWENFLLKKETIIL